MKTTTCTACRLPIPAGLAVQRTDLRTVRSYHKACFVVVRAVAGIDPNAVDGRSLLARLAELRADRETLDA